MTWRRSIAAALLLLAASMLGAAMRFGPALPAIVLADRVGHARGTIGSTSGVSIHSLSDPDAELAEAAAAGLAYARIDLSWASTERVPGRYDWSGTDPRVAAIARHGLRPVLILAYGNPLYDAARADRGAPPPASPRSRTGFARWAAAAARRYARYAPVFEIWNEPNLDQFWPPSPDPDAYLALALQTCRAIRRVRPAATIWAPGLASRDHRDEAWRSAFLERLIASPLPRCLSAISIHPYLHWGSVDSLGRFWDRVNTTARAGGRPVVDSESGISDYAAHVTADTQASYLVRLHLGQHMAGVPVSIWYDWRDDGREPGNPEHHYGLHDADGRAKPAWLARVWLGRATAGRDRQCLIETTGTIRIHLWRRDDPADQLVIAWTKSWGLSPAIDSRLDLALPGTGRADPDVRATDLYGTPIAATSPSAGVWRVEAQRSPLYVRYTGAPDPRCR